MRGDSIVYIRDVKDRHLLSSFGEEDRWSQSNFRKRCVRNLKNLHANQLFVEMMLLHNIVSQIFFSKTSKFDWRIEKDIAFIYYLIEWKPINLPFFMLSQIKEATNKSRTCLPYGMILTLIFEEFRINYTREDARRLLHTDRYNEWSLHRLDYRKIDDR